MSGDNLPKPGTVIDFAAPTGTQPEPGQVIDVGGDTPVPRAEKKPGFLSNSPDDDWLSSFGKATGTVAGKVGAGVVGLPGDIAGLLDYATTGVESFVRDKPHDVLMKERAASLAKKRAEGQLQFPTSDEVYDWASDKLGAGEYTPTSKVGKYGMLAAEGAGSMLTPFGVASKGVQAASAAAKAGKGATSAALHGTKAVAPGMVLGAGATAGAAGVGEATESPGAALLFGLAAPLAPAAAKGAFNAARNPITGAREQLIDKMAGQLDPVTGARDKRATIEAIRRGGEDVSPTGAPRTTAQAYPDEGLAATQLDLTQSQDATSQARHQMNSVLERQRLANEGTLQGLAPDNADPLALTRVVDRGQQQLQDEVERLNRALATERDPVAAADIKRQIVAAERELHDGRVSALYNSVDPDGVAQVPLKNTRQVAERILDSHDPLHGEMDPKLRGWLERLAGRGDNEGLGELTPYGRAVALDKAIERARREAVMAGNGTEHEYGQLKSAIMEDLPNVQLPPTSASAGRTPAETLRAAKDLYIEGKDRFENPYVRADLKTKPYGDFATTPEAAAARIFPAGDTGARGVTAWLEAGGNRPEAVQAVQDVALARLHKLRQNGNEVRPLTQEMLDKWRNQYRGALGALDAVVPGFSTQFDNVATAQRNLNNFLQTSAAQFLGLRDPKEVRTLVNSMLTSPDGAPQIRDLLGNLPPQAQPVIREGLQRAAADHILERFTGANSGTLAGARFSSYVRSNESALKELFGSKFDNLKAIADELARIERTNMAGKTYGSSTGWNTRNETKPRNPQDPSLLDTVMTMGIAHPVVGGAGAATVAGYSAGRNFWHKLDAARQNTIKDIITDAIFDPEKMRQVLDGSYKLKGAPLSIGETVRGVAGDSRITSQTPNMSVPLRGALRGAQEGQSEIEAREQERRARGFAKGGRIGNIDHAALAVGLIRAAEKAKKGHGATTEPLLKQTDEAITKALSIANEAI